GVENAPRLERRRTDASWWQEIEFDAEVAKRGFGYQRTTGSYTLSEWQIDGIETVLERLHAGVSTAEAASVWTTLAPFARARPQQVPCGTCTGTHPEYPYRAYFYWFFRTVQSRGNDALWLRQLKELAWAPDERGVSRRPGELFDPSL